MGTDDKHGMTQVAVTIAGHVYRMACTEGEEDHLQELARQLADRIEILRQNFGEIGDHRLTIMAAITVVDELTEAQRRIVELKGEVADARSDSSRASNAQGEWADRIARSVEDAAARIEHIAQDLNSSAR